MQILLFFLQMITRAILRDFGVDLSRIPSESFLITGNFSAFKKQIVDFISLGDAKVMGHYYILLSSWEQIPFSEIISSSPLSRREGKDSKG